MGTETGVMSPQAKEGQELGRAHGADSPSEPPEEPTLPTPDLRRLALSLRVCPAALARQPRLLDGRLVFSVRSPVLGPGHWNTSSGGVL